MRDPFVASLTYVVATDELLEYSQPPPLKFENVLGAFEVSDGILLVTLKQHFTEVSAARQVVEAVLQSWEMWVDLSGNFGSLRVVFRDSKVIDRNPPPPGSPVHSALTGMAIGVSILEGRLTGALRAYPEPPQHFFATPFVAIAYYRWRQYRAGREPLQSMAYAVLTLIESATSANEEARRVAAARKLRISRDILRNIGRLSSRPGLGVDARKLCVNAPVGALSDINRHWLECAIKTVIARFGDTRDNADRQEITLADLPELEAEDHLAGRDAG